MQKIRPVRSDERFSSWASEYFDLLETLGMADKPKRYVINKDASGNPVSVRCSRCGRLFQVEDTPEGRRVEKAFETYECEVEDASPKPLEFTQFLTQ